MRTAVVSGLALLSTAIHFPVAGSVVQPPRQSIEQLEEVQSWTRPLSAAPLLELARSEPLTASEEAGPGPGQLVRRFNPAMVMPIPDVWPVDVRYAWHDGADLVAATPGRPAWVAVPNAELSRRDWSRLPLHTADGRPIRYYLDAPGDDRRHGQAAASTAGLSEWRSRFRSLALGGDLAADPRSAPYPPTQYAHLFWWNRARGLLAIQYWFYYPFNEWVNHHEADWEQVLVVLQGVRELDATAPARPLGYLYFFHDSWMQPRRLVRLAGAQAGGDHPVVFVGGRGRMLGHGGSFSGGSYPLPGRYPGVGFNPRWLAPDEEVTPGVRFLAPEDFRVVLLPEPERLDAARHPQLSWLRLPLFAGQRQVFHNLPGYRELGKDHPPIQPGVRQGWLRPPAGEPYDGLVGAAVLVSEGLRALPAPWRYRRL